jgi:hypothetical protein
LGVGDWGLGISGEKGPGIGGQGPGFSCAARFACGERAWGSEWNYAEV